jgi:hypothetical protein
MNERIRELAKQAGGHFSTHNLMSNPVQHRESIELWDKNIEKFAELIVKEMLAITDAHTEVFQTDRDKALIEHIKQSVKQHFGVEE